VHPERILIVGGGIAGLSLATALRRAGRHAELIERAPTWNPLGAGIVLSVNAMAVMRRLGLADEIAAIGQPLGRASITNAGGSPLGATDLAALEARFGSTYAVHRAELHSVLLGGAGDTSVRLGTTVDTLRVDGARAQVRTSDGREAEYDLVVGADGIHSSVRGQLWPERLPAYAGYTCWRMVVPRPAGVDATVEMWGRGRRFGLVALTRDRVYGFAVANAPPGGEPESPDAIRTRFAEFGGAVPAVLAQIREPGQLIHSDLEELPPGPWFRGPVVLVGDAAHALTPNMGQGAAMALEDVAVLAELLEGGLRLAEILALWHARREPRVRFVQNQSRRIGRVGQWGHPWLCALRNAALRALPDRLAAAALERIAAQPL
jgi:2-polyprenyl-6-methoxyphenol hydroxylase-like FAD-dependent oxidoreductase